MEYADDGDVFQRIMECQTSKIYMKEKHIWQILIQVLKGLKALHELQILHRDMKSANIFLYKDGTAKLGDLNVSKVAKKGLLYTQTGTPYYASPEVWKDQPYDLKSDIWSFGCVIYEMCSLVPPFRADDMNGLYKRVLKGQYPSIPSHYSMDMRQLIKTLLQVTPAQRPNTEQILQLPYVQKRYLKYFTKEDGSLMASMAQESQTIDLLKTIKLTKNVFKLTLPSAAYESSAKQYQTMPQKPLKKESRYYSQSRSKQRLDHESQDMSARVSLKSSKAKDPEQHLISPHKNSVEIELNRNPSQASVQLLRVMSTPRKQPEIDIKIRHHSLQPSIPVRSLKKQLRQLDQSDSVIQLDYKEESNHKIPLKRTPKASNEQREFKRLVSIYNQHEKLLSIKPTKRKPGPGPGQSSSIELPDIYSHGKLSQVSINQESLLNRRKKSIERMMQIDEITHSHKASQESISVSRPRLQIERHQRNLSTLERRNLLPLDVTGRNLARVNKIPSQQAKLIK